MEDTCLVAWLASRSLYLPYSTLPTGRKPTIVIWTANLPSDRLLELGNILSITGKIEHNSKTIDRVLLPVWFEHFAERELDRKQILLTNLTLVMDNVSCAPKGWNKLVMILIVLATSSQCFHRENFPVTVRGAWKCGELCPTCRNILTYIVLLSRVPSKPYSLR